MKQKTMSMMAFMYITSIKAILVAARWWQNYSLCCFTQCTFEFICNSVIEFPCNTYACFNYLTMLFSIYSCPHGACSICTNSTFISDTDTQIEEEAASWK